MYTDRCPLFLILFVIQASKGESWGWEEDELDDNERKRKREEGEERDLQDNEDSMNGDEGTKAEGVDMEVDAREDGNGKIRKEHGSTGKLLLLVHGGCLSMAWIWGGGCIVDDRHHLTFFLPCT